jgi:site-specific recombinase XerC
MELDDIEKVAVGFDRGVDFLDMKQKLIDKLATLYDKLNLEESEKCQAIICNQICYIMIAIIQLRNGSRICEAVNAFIKFVNGTSTDTRVVVKIAKSDGAKYDRKTKKMIKHKPRYREICFPDWIDQDIFEEIKSLHGEKIIEKKDKLMQRVRDFMLKYFECNTHSLRYSFINHMLYTEKRNMVDVAKFVGHSTVNQLVTYCQTKNTNQIFDLDL